MTDTQSTLIRPDGNVVSKTLAGVRAVDHDDHLVRANAQHPQPTKENQWTSSST